MYEELTISQEVIFVQNHRLLNHWGINWKVAMVVNIAIHSSDMHMSTAHVNPERVCTC
jgi:hypothetical protein